MKTNSFFKIYIIILAVISLTGCDIIADIFKGGVFVGVIITVAIIGLIIWLISKRK